MSIDCVVLNACNSDLQAKAIVEHINYTIGMSQPILDKTAYHFLVGFYECKKCMLCAIPCPAESGKGR